MPRRILLINSNTCDQPYPVFPLGLSCVDTALRQAGYETRLYDCQMSLQTVEEVIAEYAPDFVGISLRNVDDIQFVQQRTYYAAPIELAQRVRRATSSPVILGGSAFSLYPERLLRLTGADFGIQGEGEVSAVRLIEALERRESCATVPGLAYRENGHVVLNPRAPLPGALIAPAERNEFLAEEYRRRSSMLSVQTQRGCPLACCYCTYPLIEGRTPRQRDPDAVADELAGIERLGAKYIFITDSVFNTTAEHAAAVCEAILSRGVKLRWCCFLKPSGLDRELINLMARAGLSHVEFGTDSLCDPVLREYGKSFTADEVLEVSRQAHAAKIHQAHFFICGGPGETPETLRTTFENSQRLTGAVNFALVGMRIYPGTRLERRARQEGVIDDRTDLLKPVYYFSREFDEKSVTTMLYDFKRQTSNWIVGELPPSFPEFAARLRQRGVVGPLWEYFQALQRLT